MKRTRHTPEQIVAKLREADAMIAAGRSIAQIVQQLGVGEGRVLYPVKALEEWIEKKQESAK